MDKEKKSLVDIYSYYFDSIGYLKGFKVPRKLKDSAISINAVRGSTSVVPVSSLCDCCTKVLDPAKFEKEILTWNNHQVCICGKDEVPTIVYVSCANESHPNFFVLMNSHAVIESCGGNAITRVEANGEYFQPGLLPRLRTFKVKGQQAWLLMSNNQVHLFSERWNLLGRKEVNPNDSCLVDADGVFAYTI